MCTNVLIPNEAEVQKRRAKSQSKNRLISLISKQARKSLGQKATAIRLVIETDSTRQTGGEQREMGEYIYTGEITGHMCSIIEVGRQTQTPERRLDMTSYSWNSRKYVSQYDADQMLLTLLGLIPLTFRSCSTVHWDLLTNEEESPNFFNFVIRS